MPATALLEPRRSRDGAAFDLLSRVGPLAQLAWLCRLLSPFATRAHILDRRPRLDWPAIFRVAGDHGLLLSIFPALDEHALLDLAPADALAALVQIDELAHARRLEAAAQIGRVSRAMNAIGIVPLWLKGAALMIDGSPWAARRWMSDIDLWVEPGRGGDAREALERLGYRHDARQPSAADHHLRPLFHHGEPFAVEIHHALAPRESAGILPLDRVLAHARDKDWQGARVRVPSARDQAVHIAAQARPAARAYLHGRVKPRRVVEFAQLAATLGAADAIEALRLACRDDGHRGFAEEFLALASGLCALPGDFERRGAMAGFACRATFPSLHMLYAGFRSVARPGIAAHARHPFAFAKKAAQHVRLARSQRW